MGAKQNNSTWLITGEEHTHLAKVLRLNVGTEVEVMAGLESGENSGSWCIGVLTDIKSGSAVVSVTESMKDLPGLLRMVIAVGALGHGELDEVIPPLVELGVDEIVVFGQVDQSKSRINEKSVDRWQRMILNACKQCKRALFPKLTVLKNCEELVALSASWGVKLVGAAEAGPDLGAAANGVNQDSPEFLAKPVVAAVIGSEKGLSDRETILLTSAGFTPVRLGNHVLRAKTAAIAVAAVLADRLARPPSLMI